MQINSSMLSTSAYQALVSVSVLFDYATSKPAIQEPWIQTSWNHAFLGKNAVIWNGQTFSHVLVWSFIAVLYCHMFSSTETDLVDFRPWLSQQHCLQSWFRPGSIVQSGPPRPIHEGCADGGSCLLVITSGPWKNFVMKEFCELLLCSARWGHFHPSSPLPLYRLIYWNCLSGNSCFSLEKKLHPDKSIFYFARVILLVVLSRISRVAMFRVDICGSFVPCVALSVLQQLMMYMDSWYWNTERATGQCQAW